MKYVLLLLLLHATGTYAQKDPQHLAYIPYHKPATAELPREARLFDVTCTTEGFKFFEFNLRRTAVLAKVYFRQQLQRSPDGNTPGDVHVHLTVGEKDKGVVLRNTTTRLDTDTRHYIMTGIIDVPVSFTVTGKQHEVLASGTSNIACFKEFSMDVGNDGAGDHNALFLLAFAKEAIRINVDEVVNIINDRFFGSTRL